MSRERRVTDPTTGGQKGQKIERFDLVPAGARRALARVFGVGGLKYDDNNWRKGYSWSLGDGALNRHLTLWEDGQSYDDETGSHHLIQVAWHAFVLYTFETLGLGKDDLPDRQEKFGLTAAEAAVREEEFIAELEEKREAEES